MSETNTEVERGSSGCLEVFLVGVAVGLAMIVFGWPTDATKPWLYLLWGVFLLRPLVLRFKPSRMWGEPIDRRTDPYRFWLTLVVAVVMIGGGIYGLATQ